MTNVSRQPEKPHIIISDADQGRLTTLAMHALDRHPAVAAELLAEMERALVRPEGSVPSDVVRMGSTVVFRSDDGQVRRVVLVFPGQADIGAGKVSVLTPIGAALIGLSEGQSITWLTRDGKSRRLTVVTVEGTTDPAVPASTSVGQPPEKGLRTDNASNPENARVVPANATTGFREAVAVFDTVEALEAAIDELLSSGFHRAQLSLLASESEVVAKLGHKYRRSSELADEASVPRAAYVSTEAIGDGEGAVIGALMSFKLRPHPQRAFVRADPRTKLDALGGEEAPLEFTIVGDIEVGTLEAVDHLAECRRIRNILIDDVMHGRGARRDRLGRSHQRVHGIRDAAVPHHVDACNLDDRIRDRIRAGGFDVDHSYQGRALQ